MRSLPENRVSIGEGTEMLFLHLRQTVEHDYLIKSITTTDANVGTINLLVQMTLEGESYHKSCFKCSHGGCILTTSSYAALNGILYCKIHFSQLFKEKGSYNHLIQTAQTKKNEAAEAASEPPADAGAAEPEAPAQSA
jgi:Rieske Fe-S protein